MIVPSSLAGRPVACILPWSKSGSSIRVLSGDAEVTASVSESKPSDVGHLIAVLLRGLSPAARRRAMEVAMSRSDGPKLDVVPLAALMPEDATIEQLASLWNGLALMLLALSTSSADTSVGTVVANASAMASGSPFASDPMVGERQNEVILAKAILEASLLDDETAKKWFEDNKLRDALERIAVASMSGSSDADPIAEDAMHRIAELYDCYIHDEPLGGDVAAGDVFGDIWSRLKQGVGEGIQNLANRVATNLGVPGSDKSSGASGGTATASSMSHAGQSGVTTDGADAATTVASELDAAKEAVQHARSALDGGQANIAEYRAKLKTTALQQAKLQWADAILNAPEEVATMLAATTPNMADPSGFLQSMLSTLSAAKATGNIGTLKALLYALKSAASSGNASADSLYSMLSGDLLTDVESGDQMTGTTDSVLNQRLIAQKEALAVAREAGADDFSERVQDTTILPSGGEIADEAKGGA